MSREFMAHIAKLGLTGEQHDVFLALLSQLDFENYIRINQEDIAKELGISRPQVSRSIKKLLEEDIICEGHRAGLCKTYILNPNVGIKGKQKKNKMIDYAEKKAQYEQEKKFKAQKKSRLSLAQHKPDNADA